MYKLISLKRIIEKNALDYFEKRKENFSSQNPDVEYFIKNKALDYEKRCFCRTFLLIDKDSNIAGYFTLGLKTLAFQDYVSNNKKKAIHGISSDVSSVPVILIGQFSKNLNIENKIQGDELLQFAMDMVYKAQDIVGGRICLVETSSDETNQKVIDFYEKCGFIKLQTDDNGTFQQMYRKIK